MSFTNYAAFLNELRKEFVHLESANIKLIYNIVGDVHTFPFFCALQLFRIYNENVAWTSIGSHLVTSRTFQHFLSSLPSFLPLKTFEHIKTQLPVCPGHFLYLYYT
jgi:hypothetical protein